MSGRLLRVAKEIGDVIRKIAGPRPRPGERRNRLLRIAVEDVMARYVWAVDSLDPEGYVAVFTEDAIIDSNGSISKGREEIRKIVLSLIQRRDDNKAKGLPASNLYHVISNVRITFPKPGEALHQSYWQTVRRDKDGKMTAAAMGRSEDRLVKRNGKWLIQARILTVFTD